MFNYFLDWMDISSLFVSDDIKFIFASVAALLVLSFIIDFFKFVLYYVGGGK